MVIMNDIRPLRVALRLECVDRNVIQRIKLGHSVVALRLECVDRNPTAEERKKYEQKSHSAWSAWIEISTSPSNATDSDVALRLECVDRNIKKSVQVQVSRVSHSAWSAWIEIKLATPVGKPK